MASGILAMVFTVGIAILFLVSSTVYDGQIETNQRNNLYENIYYITREIQSAEGIKISADSKTLSIKQRGSSDYSLIYKIMQEYPVDYLSFKSKKILFLNYTKSNFSFDGNCVKINLAIVKNGVRVNQVPTEMCFNILARIDNLAMEVVN